MLTHSLRPPSHSGNAEQGDDEQGSPMSDRTLLAQTTPGDAISCLTLAQRWGTIDSYQSKWYVFQTCCGKEGIHPVFPTLHKLVDFLNYLFTERKLSVSAIKGYKSALATSLRLLGKCLG
jgi:hypothetical protein